MKLKKETIKINNDELQFEVLDIHKILEIIKSFPDGLNKDNISLTPQPWWGNLDDPSIIILGINPSCRDSDLDYNKADSSFKNDFLIPNLNYYDRDKTLYLDELFSGKFKDNPVIRTWRVEYKLGEAFSDKLDTIAIYNAFAYYQTNLFNIKNDKILELTHIKGKIKNKLVEDIIKPENHVYFLWGGEDKRKIWMKILCDDSYSEEKNNLIKGILTNAKAANIGRNANFNNVKTS